MHGRVMPRTVRMDRPCTGLARWGPALGKEQATKVSGMIMAGGEGKRLIPTTAERAKYRIIDFVLRILIAETDRRLYHDSGTGKEVRP